MYIEEKGIHISNLRMLHFKLEDRVTPHKYSFYHKHFGHDMEQCWQLRGELEKLITQGYLKKFVLHPDNQVEEVVWHNRRRDKQQPNRYSKDQGKDY